MFRFVIRNLRKRPFLNLIKIMGLALGLSGILFISLFLKNEFSYDRDNAKADRVYRVTSTNPRFLHNAHFARLYNSGIIPGMADYFPEIESYVRLAPIKGGVMMHNEKYYDINEAFVCDSTFFNFFDAQLLIGNKNTILDHPGSMVLSESFAKKIFGNEDPVGQIISIPPGQYYGKKIDFTVEGVMRDFPQNRHFHPDLITSSSTGKIGWWAFCYLLLKPNANPQNIIDGYNGYLAKNSDLPKDFTHTQLHLQKLTDIHLHSHKLREIEENGNMTNIYVMAIAALVLLLISLSNFASLNIGMSVFNLKFISVNRILGSGRNTNLKYFIIESTYIVAISVLLTTLISIPAKLYIQKYFGINLFQNNLCFSISVIIGFSILSLLTGLQPALKQNIQRFAGKQESLMYKNSFISKGIIIMQYALAIMLIVAVTGISKQTNYALRNSMGDEHSDILIMKKVPADVQKKFEVFKDELMKHQSIQSVSAMFEPPGGEANDMFQFELDDKKNIPDNQGNNLIGVFPCDYSFASLFKLKFLSGNNFSENNTDVAGSGEYIINESAMKRLGITSPDKAIGRDFKLIFPNAQSGINIPRGKIIGVVKDFHLSSMKRKVNPLVFFKRDHMFLLNFAISYHSGQRKQAIADLKNIWNEMFPAYPFHFEQISTMYKKVYKSELLQARLLTLFTIIALFITSMGLLGLSLLSTQQRVKEIGIRKVNGAKVSEVMTMLNKDFVKWVAIAFVIATPIAWFAMHKWLENFAYKTTLSWWIFALSGILALGIALLTVSFQSWKAATRNPVEALRYE